MSAIIPRGTAKIKRITGPVVLGVDLSNAQEEMFVRMVTDGIALGIAFTRAGFKSKNNAAPSLLWALPRIQERANAILEARRTTGVVTLPEVTEMLQRVFTGAYHKEEYSAAHNAAFSLARLYGHVTDKSTLEVIRRPSRDPDAPSEQALEAWALSLPVVSSGPASPDPALLAPRSDAPANLLDQASTTRPGPSQGDLFNEINWLDGSGPGPGPGRPENGAPVVAVTGTPVAGAHSELLACPPPGGSEKGAPLQNKQVPGRSEKYPELKLQQYPPAEDLF